MFDHVEFPVGAIARNRSFFAAVLSEMGIEGFFFDQEAGSAGFGSGDTTGLLVFEGELGPRRLHICFSASSKEHAAAIKAGRRDNGGPGYRDHYSPGYFAAFVFDPDGNNIEFLFREPNPEQ
ncbi:MAG: VOC family protein [Rhizobiales bacterium]|nr:VOC family protein [Hyphomicrobiales bacterium]